MREAAGEAPVIGRRVASAALCCELTLRAERRGGDRRVNGGVTLFLAPLSRVPGLLSLLVPGRTGAWHPDSGLGKNRC